MRLFKAELNERRQPALLKGEVERGILPKVNLSFDGLVGGVEGCLNDVYTDGYALLTDYRLIWVCYNQSSTAFDGVPCHIPLGAIAQSNFSGGFLALKPSRIKLHIRLNSSGYPSSDALSIAQVVVVRLQGKSKEGMDAWYGQLQAAINRRAWAVAPEGLMQELHAATPPSAARPHRAGPMTPPPSLLQSSFTSAAGVTPSRPSAAHAALTSELQAIGFTETDAAAAVAATNGAGAQEAVTWICEGGPSRRNAAGGAGHGGSSSGGGDGESLYGLPTAAASPSVLNVSNPLQRASQYHPTASATPPLANTVFNAVLPPPQPNYGYQQVQHSQDGWHLDQQQQHQKQRHHQQEPGRSWSGVGVGVAGVLQREERKAAETNRMLGEAFSDLAQLMGKAKEMVKLAEDFRARAQRSTAAAAAGSPGEDDQMDDVLAAELADLGIASPVTRETAGKLYYVELARQLAAVMQAPVAEAGGMLPLPEVYRLFCRARGVDLVSPDDLLHAVRRLPDVGAPLRVKEFESGVKVLQLVGLNEEATWRKLVELAAKGAGVEGGMIEVGEEESKEERAWLAALGPGVSRVEAAAALGVPLPVAGVHLAAAEVAGLLCRDDGPDGLRFYKNFFATATAA